MPFLHFCIIVELSNDKQSSDSPELTVQGLEQKLQQQPPGSSLSSCAQEEPFLLNTDRGILNMYFTFYFAQKDRLDLIHIYYNTQTMLTSNCRQIMLFP